MDAREREANEREVKEMEVRTGEVMEREGKCKRIVCFRSRQTFVQCIAV